VNQQFFSAANGLGLLMKSESQRRSGIQLSTIGVGLTPPLVADVLEESCFRVPLASRG
jgi:hypothetical protein